MSLLNFGMIFQEYNISWKNIVSPSKYYKNMQISYMRFTWLYIFWLVFTYFLIMFFVSNLKSSYVAKLYEKEIETLDEIIERYYKSIL